jgi:hypothetical protein
MRSLPLAAAIIAASTGIAFSQASPSQPAQNPSAKDQGTASQPNQPIGQQVQNNLAQAGYTDIKIMPESFLVRAKDKTGNPVMMVINPDSITSITDVSPRSSHGATTGQAPATGNPNATQPGAGPK